MSELTLLIPANKEVESLPSFLDELNNYDYKILVVLQKEDTETIKSISHFKNIEILIQKEKGYGSALKEGLRKIETNMNFKKQILSLWLTYSLMNTLEVLSLRQRHCSELAPIKPTNSNQVI